DAVRKVDKQQAEVTVRVLGAEMATGTIAKSFNNLRDQLNAAQTVVDNFDFNSLSIGSQLAQQALNDIRALQGLPPLALDVGREKLAGAILDLVKIQDQINKIDGTKAQVTVEVIEKGIRNGQLTNNLSNLTAQRDAARQAFYNAPIDSPEQNKALQAYFRANSKVLKQEEKLNNTPEKQLEDAKRAAENVQQSFDRAKETVSQIKDELQNASERVADAFARALEAQRALRSSLEGAFEYLTADQKGRLEDQARRDVSIANSRGIFDSNVTDKLKGQELIAAANSARGIFAAEDNVKKANADLATSQAALAGVNSKLVEATNNQVKAQGELSKAIGVLNEKQWTVNVNVPGGSASGDVVGAVNSRS
ncbi:hypothetical protein EBT31_21305, partial [bacterium]|nr:hypothetical protein [bacterium]